MNKKLLEKKMKLLDRFIKFMDHKCKEDPIDESYIKEDKNLKNAIIFTDEDTGEQLKLYVKIKNGELIITNTVIPRKKI